MRYITLQSKFCHGMLCISAAYAVTRCPSVRLSVTFVYSVETSKYIFNFFHRRVATPLWFFCIKRYGNIPTRRFLTGTSNAGGVSRNCDSELLASLRAVNAATGQVLSTRRRRTTVPQIVTLIADSKRRSLLMTGDDDEMFTTRSLNVTPNWQQNSI